MVPGGDHARRYPAPSMRIRPVRSGATRASSGVWAAATSRSSGRSSPASRCRSSAILTLGAGAIEVALLRSMDLVAALVVGLVAGAWVDRLRRRPVLIWADLGRAVLLGTIPVAFVLGGLTLLAPGGRGASARRPDHVLRRGRQRVPADRRRARALVEANSALAATSAAAEFAGVRDQRLPRPAPDRADRDPHRRAVTFVVSALSCVTIRRRRRRRRRAPRREPVLDEIRARPAPRRARPDPARVRAAPDAARRVVGRLRRDVVPVRARRARPRARPRSGSSPRSAGSRRSSAPSSPTRPTTRVGVGPVAHRRRCSSPASATCSSRWRRRRCRSSAFGFVLAQQLVPTRPMTVYDITDVSVRQSLVDDRELGRVAATFHVAGHGRAARRRRSVGAACWPRSSACAPRCARRRSAASARGGRPVVVAASRHAARRCRCWTRRRRPPRSIVGRATISRSAS